ncbi:outer membrane beta-barrel protein [Mangrovicella endophytica]|uniref:outer membrane beta-barrel protein n=1 Tax=Mangrovicella endophytica TaxID=2066697 RepID=UPI000C9DBE87|nr:outer membrane beta-barrel protein [Mangrovicella endophytica]
MAPHRSLNLATTGVLIAAGAVAVLAATTSLTAAQDVVPATNLRQGRDISTANEDLRPALSGAPSDAERLTTPSGFRTGQDDLQNPQDDEDSTFDLLEDATGQRKPLETAAPDAAPQLKIDFEPMSGPTKPASFSNAPASAAGAAGAKADKRKRKPGDKRERRQERGRNGSRSEATDRRDDAELRGAQPLDAGLPVGTVADPLREDRAGIRTNLAATGLRPPPRRSQDDPFAPVGLRAGNFNIYSTLDQSAGYSSNLDKRPNGVGGAFSETTTSFRLLSDWAEHEAEINALFGYRYNFGGEARQDPRAAVDGRLRLDVDRLTTATLRGAMEYRREEPNESDDDTVSAADRPDIFRGSASAQVERHFGDVVVGVTGGFNRESYSKKEGAAADDSFTTYTAAIRGGYEISPAIKPFVEASLGRRVFDDTGADGVERDSLIEALRAGVEADFGEKLSGEAAVGYAQNVPDADGLPTKGTPTFDASLAWSPRRGTDVTLGGLTRFDPDASNLTTKVVYEGTLAVKHRATARTDVTAALSTAFSDSDVPGDDETTYAAETGFTYWLNRTLAFTGLLRTERNDSANGLNDYTVNSAKLGIRLQH